MFVPEEPLRELPGHRMPLNMIENPTGGKILAPWVGGPPGQEEVDEERADGQT